MSKLGFYSIAITAIMTLSGCAQFNQPNDALGSGSRTTRTQAQLEVPPDLINTSSAALKRRSEQIATEKVLPRIDGLEIKRNANGERWLEVDADIEQTWDKLVDYTLRAKLPILNQSKRDAIIESDWIGDKRGGLTQRSRILNFFGNFGNQSAINDKYTFWLERSSDDSTALHISHKQLKLVQKDSRGRDKIRETAWVESSTDTDGFKPVEMLRSIKAFFGGLHAEDVSEDVALISDDSPRIIVRLNMLDTRTQLGRAIVAANLEVVSENKEKHIIVVREHRKKDGIFSKLAIRKKRGIKIEPYDTTDKTKITVTSSRGNWVKSNVSLPLLYRLAGELRK